MPRDIADRLGSALAPFKNREAAFALALFIARFWSAPNRVSGSFPIDRRALADHVALELTEARVRGAIKTLEAIGFLDRALAPGSTYKPTEHGLRKKPVKFMFGSEYGSAFVAANARAAAAHGSRSGAERTIPAEPARRPLAALAQSSILKSPKSTNPSEKSLLMGEVRREIGIPPKAFVPDPKLEAALERLKMGIRQAEGGKTGSSK